MKIGIIGGGIIGLTTGVVLAEAGHDVEILTREPIEHTTSWAAGATCYPFAAEESPRSLRWLDRVMQILTPLVSDPSAGVILTCWRKLSEHETCEKPYWLGHIKNGRFLEKQECPPPYRSGVTAPLLLMAVDRYAPYVMDRFLKAGGRYMRVDVPTANDLQGRFEAIINATGVYASEFAGDISVRPARGQVVIVKNREIKNHTALFEKKFYIYPRGEQCLLGGSYDLDQWDRTPDPALTQEILDWAATMEPCLKTPEILDVRVGLRPLRPTVRLEKELLPDGTPLIHNYGHGGAGYTLSWGCAFDVLKILETL